MTNPQNYAAVFCENRPIDAQGKTGVNSIAEDAARIHVTRAESTMVKLMREVRATGKCGTLVARWDGQAWCFHRCESPCRVNE